MNEVITIQDLEKNFGTKKVLSGLNFSVYSGENLVILGKSGEGKSVTLKCITGLLRPDAGSVKVFNEEIALLGEEDLKKLRSRIGYLFQGSALYDSMTVKENLAFPLKRVLKIKDDSEIEARCVAILKSVGLPETMNKMPSELSGGMKKRMALARTLIVNPGIILYDEPTTGLDPVTAREISHLILDMQKKFETTSVIVSHDMACARLVADRIIVMREGKMIADGSVEDMENSTDNFINSFFK